MFIVSEMKYWTEVSEELMARKAEIQIGTRQVFEFDELVGTIEREMLDKESKSGHAASILGNLQSRQQFEQSLKSKIRNLFPDFKFK